MNGNQWLNGRMWNKNVISICFLKHWYGLTIMLQIPHSGTELTFFKIKAHQTGGLCKQRWQPPFNTVESVCKEAKNTYLLFVRTTKRQESVWSGIEQWITSVLDGGHHNAAVPFVEQSIQMRSLRGNGVDRNIKRDRFPSWPGTCNIPYPLSLHMLKQPSKLCLSPGSIFLKP